MIDKKIRNNEEACTARKPTEALEETVQMGADKEETLTTLEGTNRKLPLEVSEAL